jgi:hypothetical protein
MEPALMVRDREPEEEWDAAVAGRDAAGETGREQVLEEIVSVQIVVKKCHIRQVRRVTNRFVPNAVHK